MRLFADLHAHHAINEIDNGNVLLVRSLDTIGHQFAHLLAAAEQRWTFIKKLHRDIAAMFTFEELKFHVIPPHSLMNTALLAAASLHRHI